MWYYSSLTEETVFGLSCIQIVCVSSRLLGIRGILLAWVFQSLFRKFESLTARTPKAAKNSLVFANLLLLYQKGVVNLWGQLFHYNQNNSMSITSVNFFFPVVRHQDKVMACMREIKNGLKRLVNEISINLPTEAFSKTDVFL